MVQVHDESAFVLDGLVDQGVEALYLRVEVLQLLLTPGCVFELLVGCERFLLFLEGDDVLGGLLFVLGRVGEVLLQFLDSVDDEVSLLDALRNAVLEGVDLLQHQLVLAPHVSLEPVLAVDVPGSLAQVLSERLQVLVLLREDGLALVETGNSLF